MKMNLIKLRMLIDDESKEDNKSKDEGNKGDDEDDGNDSEENELESDDVESEAILSIQRNESDDKFENNFETIMLLRIVMLISIPRF